jgi:hypothetical protein
LEDLDKAHVFEPNNALTLNNCADVKKMFKYYGGILKDLDKVHVPDPNDAFALSNLLNVKKMLKDYQGAIGGP